MRLIKLLAAAILFISFAAFADTPAKDALSNSKKMVTAEFHSSNLTPADCGALTPRTLAYVCDRIADAGLTNQCFQAGQDRYLDQCALSSCDRFTEAGPTIQCIGAIADRNYQLDEVMACDRMTGVQDTVDCFAAAGRWVGHHGNVNVHEVKRYVIDALDYLDQNRTEGARLTLQELLEYLRQ